MASTPSYDALIIGGGHNGLICACYLAARRAQGARARAPRRGRRRRGHRGVLSRLPQFDRKLHGEPAASRSDSRLEASREHGLRIVERPMSNFLPLSDAQYLKIGPSLERTQARGGALFGARRRTRCRPITRCWSGSPTCCASSRCRRRPTSAAACATSLRGAQGGRTAAPARHDRASRRARPVHEERRRSARRAGSSRRRSRRRSASMPSSATSRARIRPARPTCCCITSSAKSTADAAHGDTRSAAWARSRRRWRRKRARAASRSTPTAK